MLQNVAVIDKGADDIRIAEVQGDGDAGVGALPCPVGQVIGVANSRIVDRYTIHRQHLEVQLMNVEDVVFKRAVLDNPGFHRAGMHDDVRRLAHGVGRGCASILGDEERGRTVGIGWVLELLGKIEGPLSYGGRRGLRQTGEALRG